MRRLVTLTSISALAVTWLSPDDAAAQPPGTQTQPLMQPSISLTEIPLIEIRPIAHDGHAGSGYFRRPPGEGPFPAVLIIPGGGSPVAMLRRTAIGAYASRFLESGYAVAVITYRGYGADDTWSWSPALSDALAALTLVRSLASIDPASVVPSGCSIGGDIALELAAEARVPALVAEEPGTVFIARLHRDLIPFLPESDGANPRDDARAGSEVMRNLVADLPAVYTTERRAQLEGKLHRIDAPLLIVQGDRPVDSDVFLPIQYRVLLPAFEATGVRAQFLRYPDTHCFAMDSVSQAGIVAFSDIERFVRAHVQTRPEPIDPALVEHVPASVNFGRESIVLPVAVLDEFAGDYRFAPGSAFAGAANDEAALTIVVQGNGLSARLGPTPPVVFTPESETVFFSEIGDFEFFRDDDGRIDRVIYRNDLVLERMRSAD